MRIEMGFPSPVELSKWLHFHATIAKSIILTMPYEERSNDIVLRGIGIRVLSQSEHSPPKK